MSADLIAQLIYTSSDLAVNHVKYAEKIQREPGIKWGVDAIDKLVLPSRGGDVSLIVGRPGDGKTSLLTSLARRECDQIVARGKENEEVVVYITYEGTVDNIYTGIIASGEYSISDYHWGRVPLEKVGSVAVKRGVMPIIMIGFSTFRKHDEPILMTLDKILDSVRYIEQKLKKRPTLLLIDYLQLIPVKRSENKVDQVARAIVQAKSLGMDLDLPTFMGAQASRDVDRYDIRLAEKSDVQWSSQAEQHTDKMFSITRPILYKHNGTIIEINKKKAEVTPNLLVMAMKKQRNEQGSAFWYLEMNPQLLTLAEYEHVLEEF